VQQSKGDAIIGSYVDEALAMIVGTAKYYYHANHLYSVAALTDSAKNVVERYRYDAYGNRIVLAADGVTTRTASNFGQQIGFTGRYLDKETGLYYFRARYYSGTLGRFIGRDPIGYVDGYQLYMAYFAPDGLDPWGLWDTSSTAAAAAAAHIAAQGASTATTVATGAATLTAGTVAAGAAVAVASVYVGYKIGEQIAQVIDDATTTTGPSKPEDLKRRQEALNKAREERKKKTQGECDDATWGALRDKIRPTKGLEGCTEDMTCEELLRRRDLFWNSANAREETSSKCFPNKRDAGHEEAQKSDRNAGNTCNTIYLKKCTCDL
jgi:RHS repeat-associated protein